MPKPFPASGPRWTSCTSPQGRYQLTLVDDCSRYVDAGLLQGRTAAAVCKALQEILARFPFPLRCIQTDNGPEFGQEVSRLLAGLSIRHTRIRVRSPPP